MICQNHYIKYYYHLYYFIKYFLQVVLLFYLLLHIMNIYHIYLLVVYMVPILNMLDQLLKLFFLLTIYLIYVYTGFNFSSINFSGILNIYVSLFLYSIIPKYLHVFCISSGNIDVNLASSNIVISFLSFNILNITKFIIKYFLSNMI